MRQKLRSVLCLFALLLFLPVSARANGLPRPYIRIEVKQPNQPIEWIAMLSPDAPNAPQADIPKALTAALPDGWYVWECVTDPEQTHTASFWGTDMPETFRIAILLTDSTTITTPEAMRTRAMQTFTVDAQTGAITTLPSWVGLLLQFACTCSITLVIEAVVLLLFRFSWRENWKPFLLVNLATQVLMSLTFGRELVNSGGYGAFLLVFLIELIIFVIEALAYARLLHGYTRQRRVAYAFIANLLSFVFGILCIAPVYSSIAGLM